MKYYKVFDYIEALDCFVVNPEFKELIYDLGLNEWNEVVWIGRYLTLDNDYGEHWFDNWDERERIEELALKLGYKHEDLMIIEPTRFANGKDGPCHADVERKRFWTDVCKSLSLSIHTIVSEARRNNERNEKSDSSYLADLETRIEKILNKINST